MLGWGLLRRGSGSVIKSDREVREKQASEEERDKGGGGSDDVLFYQTPPKLAAGNSAVGVQWAVSIRHNIFRSVLYAHVKTSAVR
jgi:hypothetical protein